MLFMAEDLGIASFQLMAQIANWKSIYIWSSHKWWLEQDLRDQPPPQKTPIPPDSLFWVCECPSNSWVLFCANPTHTQRSCCSTVTTDFLSVVLVLTLYSEGWSELWEHWYKCAVQRTSVCIPFNIPHSLPYQSPTLPCRPSFISNWKAKHILVISSCAHSWEEPKQWVRELK